MAADSRDSTTGAYIFLDGGAPDIAVDPTLVSEQANDVGTRIIRDNLAELNDYEYARAGLGGHALDTRIDYVHDGSGWVPFQQATLNRFVRVIGSDASVGAPGYVNLVEGTIANAKPGRYLVVARASLYSSGGNVVGRVYAETQSGVATLAREEARWDLPNTGGTYPMSPTVQVAVSHPGGNLRVAVGYRLTSGTFYVTSQVSGETVVTATYLGPA